MVLNKKIKDILLFSMLIIIISITGITINYIRNCNLKKNIYFSIATPIKESNGRGENNVLYVHFFYKNRKMENKVQYFNIMPKIGQKYFIAINEENIDQSVLFSNCPVPDSFEVTPYGWDKIPIDDYQKDVDAYFEKMLNSGIYKLFPDCCDNFSD